MHNVNVLIKLLGIVLGNHSSIILRLLLFESVPLRVQSHIQPHNKHIRHMKFIIPMHVKKSQPILVKVL